MTSLGYGSSLALRQRWSAGTGFDFAGTLPAGATLTRGSVGTRFDAGGSLVSVAANAARFDYDPATLVLRGLLVEPAATNLALASEGFDGAAWTVAGANVTVNAGPSPAGAVTADKLVESTGTGQHRVQQAIASTIGQTYCLSVFAKAAERSSIWLHLIAGTGYASAIFDLSARTISGISGSAAIVALGGGWSRVSVAGLSDGAATIAYLNLVDPSGSGGYSGNGSAGLLLWGAQIEAGPASSYIATTGAAATRATDAVSLDWASRGVRDGTPTVRYTFDDGSTQDVTTAIAGGVATVPTTLARPTLRRAAVV